jgi:hypothetical protein
VDFDHIQKSYSKGRLGLNPQFVDTVIVHFNPF